jgi:hypothetical protein
MFISVKSILVTSHGEMQNTFFPFSSSLLLTKEPVGSGTYGFEPGTLIEADNLATLRLFRRSINIICTAHTRNLHKAIERKHCLHGGYKLQKISESKDQENKLKNTSQGTSLRGFANRRYTVH